MYVRMYVYSKMYLSPRWRSVAIIWGTYILYVYICDGCVYMYKNFVQKDKYVYIYLNIFTILMTIRYCHFRYINISICVYVHIFICICIYIHILVHKDEYVYMYETKHIYHHDPLLSYRRVMVKKLSLFIVSQLSPCPLHMYLCVYIYIHLYIYLQLYTYVYVSIYELSYVSVSIYVYTYI
jgi:hypothetical protein